MEENLILDINDLIIDEIYEIKVNDKSVIAQYKERDKRIAQGAIFKIISSSRAQEDQGGNYYLHFALNKVLERTITKLS